MAGRFFSNLASTFSSVSAGLGRDFRQGLDFSRERGALVNVVEGSISEAAPLVERAKCEATGTHDFFQGHDRENDTVQTGNSEAELTPLKLCMPDHSTSGPDEETPAPKVEKVETVEHLKIRTNHSTALNAEEVLMKTAKSLVSIDFMMAGFYLEELNDNEVSAESQEQIVEHVQKIRKVLAVDNDGNRRNPETSLTKAREALKTSEDVTKNVLRAETGMSSELESPTNFADNFGLHAGEMLAKDIGCDLQALYTALVKQLNCCDQTHFIRLRLTGFGKKSDQKARSDLDMYLSSGNDCARCYWVESKVTFLENLTRRQKEGCAFIQRSIRENTKLSLLIQETWTQHADTPDVSTVNNKKESHGTVQLGISRAPGTLASPTASLASLLEQNKSRFELCSVLNADRFTSKEKGRICLNLAFSLLHLSGADWNMVNWYSDNPGLETGVFFLRDPSTQEIVDKTSPYLSWRLKIPEAQGPIKGLLCHPQLLDFARLLIEVRNWKRIQLIPDGMTNKGWKQPLKRLNKEELRLHLLDYIRDNFFPSDHDFVSAPKACLRRTGLQEAADEKKPERIQAYIFQKIVSPLYKSLGQPYEELEPAPAKVLCSNSAAPDDELEGSIPIYDQSVDYDVPEEKSRYTKKFWDRMNTFKGRYIRSLQNPVFLSQFEPYPRDKVRIAIIDSGVMEEDADIAFARATGRIRGYRNFTSSDPDSCEDYIGHGTMVARLLLEVAPEAEIYVAKVSDQKKMPKNQMHRIAQAIKWAVEWWNVDIISMSLAMANEHYDIDEELNQAASPSSRDGKPKIVFAAAGNNGPYERLAWPARKDNIIAVKATYWSGEGTRSNPNPEGNLNLATLGQDIEMRWPDRDNPGEFKNVYISGSSFATPIAAGIAANVLEFARHRMKLGGWKKDRLYSPDGMMRILKAMSGSRADCDFIHPLAMWEEANHGGVWKNSHLKLPYNDSTNICKVLEFLVA